MTKQWKKQINRRRTTYGESQMECGENSASETETLPPFFFDFQQGTEGDQSELRRVSRLGYNGTLWYSGYR